MVNIIISVKGDAVTELGEADELIVLDTAGREVKYRISKPFNLDLVEDIAEEYGAELFFTAGLPGQIREFLEEAGIKVVVVGRQRNYVDVVDELFL